MNVSKLMTIIITTSVLTIAASMIIMPKESLDASVRGLNIWWEIVFPSLFPFFVIAEILIGFGVVRFIGVLLEPLMRPLFRVPGVGGFAWAMGMATGFPAGAKITARLREDGQLTKVEAERLVCFTNNSSPLFIFGAVAVGFFHSPRLGIILAMAHYLGNFVVGLMMRFYGKSEVNTVKKKAANVNIFRQAFSTLHHARLENKKPIGQLLGDAVTNSIQTLLMIGGFIILFSVLNNLLFHLNITHLLASVINIFLSLFHLPPGFSVPLIAGLFEMTLGNQMVSELQEISLLKKTIIASFILGFSGLSIQAQVASILASTDINFKPYFFTRFAHGLFAALFTIILWKPLSKYFQFEVETNAVPVFLLEHDIWWETAFHSMVTFGPLVTIISLILYIMILVKRMNPIK